MSLKFVKDKWSKKVFYLPKNKTWPLRWQIQSFYLIKTNKKSEKKDKNLIWIGVCSNNKKTNMKILMANLQMSIK